MPLDNNPQIEQGDGGGSSSSSGSGSTSTNNSVANYYFKKGSADERIDLSVLSSFHDSYQGWEAHESHYKATYCSIGAEQTPYIENNTRVYAGWYNPNFSYCITRISLQFLDSGYFILQGIKLSWAIKNGKIQIRVGKYTGGSGTSGPFTWMDPQSKTWTNSTMDFITTGDYLPYIELSPGSLTGIRYRIQIEVWDNDISDTRYNHIGLDLNCVYMEPNYAAQSLHYYCSGNLYGTNYYPRIENPTGTSPERTGGYVTQPQYLVFSDKQASYWSNT